MKARLWLFAMLLICAIAPLSAQDRPYAEGPVTVVSSIKIKDGQFDNYMNFLSKTYKPLMEAQKKAGNVLNYGVYTTRARTPADPNLYLVVTYPNMASFDGMQDRNDAITKEVTGMDPAQASAASMERGKMREQLGSELLREMVLK